MSQIEIPDWVVEAAAKAISEVGQANLSGTTKHKDGVTFHLTKPIEELGTEAIRAALSAALEGWLVPVHQFGDASSDSEWFDGVLTSIDPDDTFYKTRTLYTLRKDKTP